MLASITVCKCHDTLLLNAARQLQKPEVQVESMVFVAAGESQESRIVAARAGSHLRRQGGGCGDCALLSLPVQQTVVRLT